mmetsp:Transcript_101448/g.262762  ORF Transcript_101448/g.262762 Transcript_101448/m.262762 type:complete len:254 (-) Transcript_101448:288-1049(-)
MSNPATGMKMSSEPVPPCRSKLAMSFRRRAVGILAAEHARRDSERQQRQQQREQQTGEQEALGDAESKPTAADVLKACQGAPRQHETMERRTKCGTTEEPSAAADRDTFESRRCATLDAGDLDALVKKHLRPRSVPRAGVAVRASDALDERVFEGLAAFGSLPCGGGLRAARAGRRVAATWRKQPEPKCDSDSDDGTTEAEDDCADDGDDRTSWLGRRADVDVEIAAEDDDDERYSDERATWDHRRPCSAPLP